MPWSTLVETMGFEPTTPCLQTLRLAVVTAADLVPGGCGAASGDRCRPGRVARAWPGRTHARHARLGPIGPGRTGMVRTNPSRDARTTSAAIARRPMAAMAPAWNTRRTPPNMATKSHGEAPADRSTSAVAMTTVRSAAACTNHVIGGREHWVTADALGSVPSRVEPTGRSSQPEYDYIAAAGDAARARMVTTRMWTLKTNTQAGNRSSSQGMTPTVRSSAPAVR